MFEPAVNKYTASRTSTHARHARTHTRAHTRTHTHTHTHTYTHINTKACTTDSEACINRHLGGELELSKETVEGIPMRENEEGNEGHN